MKSLRAHDNDPWWIVAGGKARKCRNLATAEAWGKMIVYLARKQGWSEPRILNMNMSLVHDALTKE